MKKIFIIMLSAVMVISLSACDDSNAGEGVAADHISVGSILQTVIEEASGLKPSDNAEAAAESNLIVYFSRAENTEYSEGIDASSSASIVIDEDTFGTTEYVARMIQEDIGGDLHLIRTQESYPADFDELRNMNHNEMDAGFLPQLMESSLNIDKYDTVFIGYPVWATDVPQAVLSFLKEYDLTGKTVVPFCTHDGYGAGRSYNTIKEASHGKVLLDGLAVDSKDVTSAKNTVSEWLSAIGMTEHKDTAKKNGDTDIVIKIGDISLEGVLYDTALANEIKEKFPLTISMSNYGGREYYGGVDFYPENLEGGQRNFENGDITYCEDHHNMAVFYDQTDNPNLSVDVIPIGKVTSDLSVFDTLGSREEIIFSLKE